MKKNLRNVLLYLGIPIILIIAIVVVSIGNRQVEKKTYYDIIEMFYDNEISEYSLNLYSGELTYVKREDGKSMIELIRDVLKPEGLMLFTTPTPPWNGYYEDRVWPLDHEIEYGHYEVSDIINKHFKIVKEIGWSLEEREYNRLLERDRFLGEVYLKLRGAFPESYIRAIVACLSDIDENRQVFFVCKKRRFPNGRSTQA